VSFPRCVLAVVVFSISFGVFAKENQTCKTSYELPQNQWRMISLPCEPPSGARTVQAIFGDDFSGVYDTDWVVYGYDSGYQKQALTSELEQGKGYWITSISQEAKLDLPADSNQTPSNEPASSEACVSNDGCFASPLAASESKSTWNMLGNPYLSTVAISDIRILTDGETSPNNCGDANACTLDEAKEDGIFNSQLWSFRESGGNFPLTSAGMLEPWMGFWGEALDKAIGLNPRLLIPSPAKAIATATATGFPLHKDINSTVFWVGEPADASNGYIQNSDSAWDISWKENFGGFDDPNNRNGYLPPFQPLENPFYFALPFNDFTDEGEKKQDLSNYVPWASAGDDPVNSILKNRWIKIQQGEKTAYAQWEDSGPYVYDDWRYVFGSGSERPANGENENAGLDVSPAVRDYLGLNGMGLVDWQFVDESQVPDGPWNKVITRSPLNWGKN